VTLPREAVTDGSAIAFDGVGVDYPGADRPAVDGISLEVAQGELVVLLGPSGCGKTTLLKTVNRLVELTTGRVLLEGRDAASVPATDLRRRIGYAIQATGLFPHMTVGANIAVVPRLLGWSPERIEARVAEMLELVNLPREYAARYPRQLSGGEAQRVGIARALAADPGFLLMDEPFGAIDAINRERLQDGLLEIQARLHKTILFVTHDVDEAVRLADRIAVLRDGSLVQYAPPLELLVSPADDFVADLVSADDVFRQLSLMAVGAVMLSSGCAPQADAPQDALSGARPIVRADASLRTALTQLLRSGADKLDVVDERGNFAGCLGLAEVRRMITARDTAHGPRGDG